MVELAQNMNYSVAVFDKLKNLGRQILSDVVYFVYRIVSAKRDIVHIIKLFLKCLMFKLLLLPNGKHHRFNTS